MQCGQNTMRQPSPFGEINLQDEIVQRCDLQNSLQKEPIGTSGILF